MISNQITEEFIDTQLLVYSKYNLLFKCWQLFFFCWKQDIKPKGRIVLQCCNVNPDNRKPNCFALSTARRTYYIQAANGPVCDPFRHFHRVTQLFMRLCDCSFFIKLIVCNNDIGNGGMDQSNSFVYRWISNCRSREWKWRDS
jgi:hypothetical protein